jgi:hypothetical protein
MENMTQENTQIDEEITTINGQCKEYQNQMEVRLILITKNRIFKKISSIFSNFIFNLINSNKKRKMQNHQGIENI